MKKTSFGFGFEPSRAQNHFYVVLSDTKKDSPVQIYERFSWTPKEAATEAPEETVVFADGQILSNTDVLRLVISRHKWDLVSKDFTAEFNTRLKAERKPAGKFGKGGTPVERMFGKEMMVLLWGIENCDPSNVPTAIKNWKGLLPEERWWLYTMTNASSGQLNDDFGWRRALLYALCENPIVPRKDKQYTMFEEDA